MNNETVGIIMSAAYVTSELQAEFGLIPPTFLPAGAKRLYWWQIAELNKKCDRVFVTLPESFLAGARDLKLIEALGAEIQYIPDGLSIGHSLLYALNILSLGNCKLKVLHGDTLIQSSSEFKGDALSIHETNTAYTWATIGKTNDAKSIFSDISVQSSNEDHHKVVSGYFSFTEPQLLIRALTKENGNYLNALSQYHAKRPMTAMTSGNWMDFGHIQTYQNSKKAITTERSFNTLRIHDNVVTKFSDNSFKMEAEAGWFENVPIELRLYCPPFLGRASNQGMKGYSIGYQPLSPLNDLFVFGELGLPAWDVIMSACAEFLESCAHNYDSARDIKPAGMNEFLLEKTFSRLTEFEAQSGINASKKIKVNGQTFPSLFDMATISFDRLDLDEEKFRTVMHGDFCFSNILYDSRAGKICVIDPRGFVRRDEHSIYGDIRYDIAKLYHSVVGKYDFIISGYSQSKKKSQNEFTFELDEMQFGQMAERAFLGTKFNGIDPGSDDIIAINVHLFLSMLPLHADNPERQLSLMLNATRLFERLRN